MRLLLFVILVVGVAIATWGYLAASKCLDDAEK